MGLAMRRIRYFVTLEPDYDRIRVDFETDRGEVVTLHVVQYETRHEGEWQPEARYDTAHGFFHLDLYTAQDVMKYRIYIQDSSQALTFAVDDLKANWLLYKRRFQGDV
jgi:hypothetical protein